MKISKAMLEGHIGSITNHWIIENGVPAENSEQYADYIGELKETLLYTDDMCAFQLGIDYLLTHPEVDITFLDGSEYVWEDDELRPLLIYIKEQLWSKSDLESENVELVNMSIHEWRNSQSKKNLSSTIA